MADSAATKIAVMQQKITNIEAGVNRLEVLMKDHFDHCIITETSNAERRTTETASFNKRITDLVVELDTRYAVKATEKTVDKMNDSLAWVVKVVLGVVILALLSYVVYNNRFIP